MELNKTQEEEIVAFTQELVRCPGFSGQEEKTAKCLEQKMRSLGYDEVSVDEYGDVIGVIRGKRPGPVLMFDGHMDVVDPGDPKDWEYEPHSGEIVGEDLWGRGSVDMKGGVAAMTCAAAFVDRDKIAGTVIVSGTVAEEVLPGRSLIKILEKQHVDAVIETEPTDMKLGVAEKGRGGIELITHGQRAHSSLGYTAGDNAIYRMTEAIPRIKEIPNRFDPFLGREVLTLCEIKSNPDPGNGFVPDRCRTWWECRLLADETRDGYLARWYEALGGMVKFDVNYANTVIECYTGARFEDEDFIAGWSIEEEHPLRKQVEMAIEKAGVELELYPVPYGSNANGSSGKLEIPSIIFGPGDLALVHRPNEHVPIKDLLKAARVYGNIIEMNPVAKK